MGVAVSDALWTARRLECETDGMYFNRYFMKQRGSRMAVGRHHVVLQDTLDRVLTGEISRLIITLPPGYTKTEMALIGFTARGLALHPYSRFMHLTYSDALARLSSSTTREVVLNTHYQKMWPMRLRNDSNAKNLWWTHRNGGTYATTPNGQVTGFRAGYMDPNKFTGALMIDDPIKPRDALHETIRTGINDNYGNTVASRLALETTPVVLIMQRVHYDDLAGFLLRGGSGENWHHLNMPVIIDNSKPYPKENTHGVPIDHGLPDGWLWPFKHNEEHRVALQASKRKWAAQYLQYPPKFNAEGTLWNEKLIDAANAKAQPWKKKRTVIGVDPAVSKNAASDLTGIVAASSYTDGNFTVDADKSKRYSPSEWAKAVMELYAATNADAVVVEVNQGGDLVKENLRLNGFKGRVIEVHASKGKFARAEPVVSLYELGKVKHSDSADLSELETELMTYVPETSSESPDRLDAVVYALTELAGLSLASLAW